MASSKRQNELKLTESLEDYLEAIAELIAVDGHAHTKEIAARLQVKMPSVTNALRQLDEMQLIVYNTHYPVLLTSRGEKIARRIIHRHTVLKSFFSDILGLDLQKASETACRLEHVVDENTIERFVLFSEAIERRTDAHSLQTYLTEAMQECGKPGKRVVISELKSGQKARICAFGRNLAPEKCMGLPLESRIELQAFSLDRTKVRLAVGRNVVEIPLEIAENIWVAPCE